MQQTAERETDASHAAPHLLHCERCGEDIRPCDRLWCSATGDHAGATTCAPCAVAAIYVILRE